MMMAALSCYKKERRKENIYHIKKEDNSKQERGGFSSHTFAAYHQGLWTIHTNHVYGLALWFHLSRPCATKPPPQQFQVTSTYAAGKNTQVSKGKMFTNSLLMFISMRK
jgi:hypothetical protein